MHQLVEEQGLRLCLRLPGLVLIIGLGRNPERFFEQLPNRDQIALRGMLRCGSDVDDDALDEVLCALVPMRVFLVRVLHDDGLSDEGCVFKEGLAPGFENIHRVVGGPPLVDAV